MENSKFVEMYKDILFVAEKSEVDQTVESAGVALVSNNKVFLIKPYSHKGSRIWGIPKGHVETGETLEKAAIREFEEEVGFKLKSDAEFLGTSGYPGTSKYPGKNIHAFVAMGTGKEKFKGSNLIDSGPDKGKPEVVDGQYIDIKKARKIVHSSQVKLIDLLIQKLNL